MYSYVVLLWWKLHEQKGKEVLLKYFLQKNHKSKFEDTHVVSDLCY